MCIEGRRFRNEIKSVLNFIVIRRRIKRDNALQNRIICGYSCETAG